MDSDPLTDIRRLPVRAQLERAARDLWSTVIDVGDDHVTFVDRRRLKTRVWRGADGLFHVSWEESDGNWIDHKAAYENLREAAFRGYQGPH